MTASLQLDALGLLSASALHYAAASSYSSTPLHEAAWLEVSLTSVMVSAENQSTALYRSTTAFTYTASSRRASHICPLDVQPDENLYTVSIHSNNYTTASVLPINMAEVEQGLTSHQTHYRSYRGRVFMGQMTQPTVSKH